jgi:hypothetical protein
VTNSGIRPRREVSVCLPMSTDIAQGTSLMDQLEARKQALKSKQR